MSSRGFSDQWENWEFGDEGFIDSDKKIDLDNTPLLEGKPAYVAAMAALESFVSPERRAKISEVLAQRSGCESCPFFFVY